MARLKSAVRLTAARLKKKNMKKLKNMNRDTDISDAAAQSPRQRKKPRFTWRTIANRECKRELRKSSKGKLAIPRAAMQRLVRQFAPGYQFEREAIKALCEVAENYAVDALEAANILAMSENVPTVQRRHMQTVAIITNKLPSPTPLPEAIEKALYSASAPRASATAMPIEHGQDLDASDAAA